MGQPTLELGAPMRIAQQLGTETYIGERDNTHEQTLKSLLGNEGKDLGFWFRPAKLGKDIGVVEPVGHSVTSRTGNAKRAGSSSISRCGEACAAAISAAPVRPPHSRRNASAVMTTTSSRP